MDNRRFFHLWEWYYSYLNCLASDPDALIFFLFTQGKRPLAIFPLQFVTLSLGFLKLKALVFPPHDHLPLCDLICHRDAISLPLFQRLGDHLRDGNRSWDMIQLSPLLEDACALAVIGNHPAPRFLRKHEGRCNYMDATGSYESFLAGLPKKFRWSLKRAKQDLGGLADVRFAFTQNGPELDEKLAAFMDVEASGWKGAQGSGTAIKLNPDLSCFYRTLARTLSADGRIAINTLTADGKCIAAQFCIVLDHTAYLLKLGYDEGYKGYAPGNLLVDRFMERSIADPAIERINLISDAEWFALWRTKAYDKSQLRIFNATPAGSIGFVLLKSHHTIKGHYQRHLKPRLPGRVREWISRR